MTKPKPSPIHAIAKRHCTAAGSPSTTNYAVDYLKGDYHFFGMPSEPHHRMLLEGAGIDVSRMLQDYRDRV